jgi:hypothetical protein
MQASGMAPHFFNRHSKTCIMGVAKYVYDALRFSRSLSRYLLNSGFKGVERIIDGAYYAVGNLRARKIQHGVYLDRVFGP